MRRVHLHTFGRLEWSNALRPDRTLSTALRFPRWDARDLPELLAKVRTNVYAISFMAKRVIAAGYANEIRLPAAPPRPVAALCGGDPKNISCRVPVYHSSMSKKLRWGVLSTAAIGLKKVLPAMQQGQYTSINAIASRDLAKARDAAASLDIPTAYGSYEELLADPSIDAIYNPLPNQLHVPWTIKAAEAGKHVLCEKPLSLTVAEAETLLAVRARTGVKIGEAFMIRSYPQWLRLRELLAEGRIGTLRSITGFFSYHNVNPDNIRNQVECGGGALMDIGCYLVHASRYAFGTQPSRVVACIDRDPEMHTDRLTSAILDFPAGQSIFTCSTQLVPYQRVQFLGTCGRIEIEIPFNAPPNRPTRLFIDNGSDLFGGGITTETFPVCDQYTLQGDAFSKAVLEDTEVPVPLEDAIKNMAVMEAIFDSAKSGKWEAPQR
jgi:predicted dehydrogenase